MKDEERSEQQTETWYVTFGLGTRHKGTYTEVVVDTVEVVDGYDNERGVYRTVGQPLSVEERWARVRQAAVESYGTAWAFEYAPEKYAHSIARHGMKLRERIGARRPDGSLVPVIDPVREMANRAAVEGIRLGREAGGER